MMPTNLFGFTSYLFFTATKVFLWVLFASRAFVLIGFKKYHTKAVSAGLFGVMMGIFLLVKDSLIHVFSIYSSLAWVLYTGIVILLLNIFLEGGLRKKLPWFLLYGIAGQLLQLMLVASSEELSGTDSVWFADSLASVPRFFLGWLAYVLLMLALGYLLFENKKPIQAASRLLEIAVYAVCLCLVLLHVYNKIQFDIIPPYICRLTLLATALVLLILCYLTWRQRTAYQENLYMQQLSQSYQQYYASVKEHETKVRKLKHDMANHLRTLQIMVEQGSGVEEYAQSILREYECLPKVYQSVNPVIDAVLTEKLDIIENVGIQFSFIGPFSQEHKYDNAHLAALYSTLLDYIAKNCEHGIPSLNSVLDGQGLEITLHLPSSTPAKTTGAARLAEMYSEVWELSILGNIAKKYKGSIQVECNESTQYVLVRLG